MPIAEAQIVECVKGCADNGDHTLAIIGLVVAGIAAVLAFSAFWVSRRQLSIQEREHKVLMAQLKATSDLKIDLALEPDTPKRYEVGGALTRVLRIQIRNNGEKAASQGVALNVVVSDPAQPRWARSDGVPDLDEPLPRSLPDHWDDVGALGLDKWIDTAPRSIVREYRVQLGIPVGEVTYLVGTDEPPPSEAVLRVWVSATTDDQPGQVVETGEWTFWRKAHEVAG